MKYALTGIAVLFCLISSDCFAQDQSGIATPLQPSIPSQAFATDKFLVTDRLVNFPSKFFSKINSQTSKLEASITRQTQRYLDRLAKQEDKIRKKLYKQMNGATDSAAARKLYSSPGLDYKALAQRLQSQTGRLGSVAGAGNAAGTIPGSSAATKIPGGYLSSLDSLKTSLKFLQQNPGLLSGGTTSPAQINASLAQVNAMESKMQTAGQVQQLIRQRKEQIRQTLSQYAHLPPGLQNAYQGYSREAYYYGAQVKAYKDELNDPDKLTKQAMGLLGQLPTFQQFMKTHSELAGLFSFPGLSGAGGAGGAAKALAGLQTRSAVQQGISSQIAAGGPDAAGAVSQKIESAQTQLNSLKDKISQAGGGNSGMDIPDFRPNTQHVRTFLRRLTYGFNIQSVRSNYYFPTTTDLGVSLGYKLNDRSTIGIGASYKMGWGQDIGHIAVSTQGVGLRSFFDTKIKGSFFATGGFEYNYQQPIYSLSQIQSLSAWTQSGLIGLTKQYKIGGKMKGNIQLLWDFLSYQQVPKGQPVLFRVGYGF